MQTALLETAPAPYGGSTSGRDRAEAIARMSPALEMFVVEGIHTSIPMHQRILADPKSSSVPHSSWASVLHWRADAGGKK